MLNGQSFNITYPDISFTLSPQNPLVMMTHEPATIIYCSLITYAIVTFFDECCLFHKCSFLYAFHITAAAASS